MRICHLAAVFVATASLAVTGLAPAAADPRNGFPVENVCDDGQTYITVAQAGQTWNAQLVTDSTSAFHLTWYEITYTVTEPDGTVNVFGPDEVVKGGNDRSHKNLLNCTFAFDADLGGGRTAHITGVSRGWITPSGG